MTAVWINDRTLGLLLCKTESRNLDPNEKHQGLYRGKCGVNPYIWSDILKEQGVHYNSIQGGIFVYYEYLKQTDNKKKALLEFKGVERNKKVKKIVDKIITLEKEFKPRVNNLEKIKQ